MSSPTRLKRKLVYHVVPHAKFSSLFYCHNNLNISHCIHSLAAISHQITPFELHILPPPHALVSQPANLLSSRLIRTEMMIDSPTHTVVRVDFCPIRSNIFHIVCMYVPCRLGDILMSFFVLPKTHRTG